MEEILKSISNPFEIDKFRRLINIYLNTEMDETFYDDVVNYNKDKKSDGGPIEKIEAGDSRFQISGSNGSWAIKSYLGDFFQRKHRIYLNVPNEYIDTLLSKFMEKCEERNAPYDLKYYIGDIDIYKLRNDNVVIYSCTSAFIRHIEILKEIGREHPEIVEACGTPQILTGVLDGWIGLADEDHNVRQSYTEVKLMCLKIAIKNFLIAHEDLCKQVGADLLLEKIQSKITQESKLKIKDVIEKHPEYVSEIYNLFMRECEIMDYSLENPIFLNGTREELLEEEKREYEKFPDELEEALREGKSEKILGQIYELFPFGYDSSDYSLEDSVRLIKEIIESIVKERQIQSLVYSDLKTLTQLGLIDKSIIDDFMKTDVDSYISTDKRAFLRRFEEYYYGLTDCSRDKKFISKRLLSDVLGISVTEDKKLISTENLTIEEAKKVIEERKEYIMEYLRRPLNLNELGDKLSALSSFDGEDFGGINRLIEKESNLTLIDYEEISDRKEYKDKLLSALEEIDISKMGIGNSEPDGLGNSKSDGLEDSKSDDLGDDEIGDL